MISEQPMVATVPIREWLWLYTRCERLALQNANLQQYLILYGVAKDAQCLAAVDVLMQEHHPAIWEEIQMARKDESQEAPPDAV